MGTETKYIISVETGSSAVRAAAAQVTVESGEPRGRLTLFAVADEPLNNVVQYGRVINVEEVAAKTRTVLKRLQTSPELAGKPIVGVYAGIGGRSVHTVPARVELPMPDEVEITQQVVERLQDQAIDSVDPRWEVLDIIPLGYNIDGTATMRPVGVYGRRVTADFNIVVCNPVNVRNLQRVIVDRCGLNICGFVVQPLALADMVLTAADTKPGCMLVDLGAQTTTVSIYKDNALRYLATIPMGSQHITNDLAHGLGIVEQQAETVKIMRGNAIEAATNQSAEQRQIDKFVQARVIEIIANIVAQLDYAGFSSDSLRAGIVVTGQGAKLKNFSKLLEIQSHMTVRPAAVPTMVRLSVETRNAADLLPLMAISTEGAVLCNLPDTEPCVDVPVQQPEQPVIRIDSIVDSDNDNYDDNVPSFGGQTFGGQQTDSETPHKDKAPNGRRRPDNDEYVLVDDDEAERLAEERRRREAEAQKRQAEKAERERRDAERRAEKERKRREDAERRASQPSKWQIFTERAKRMIANLDGPDDGEDM